MKENRFEVFQDRQGDFRWRLRAANGEIVANSEAYVSKAGAHRSAERVSIWATGAPVVDLV